jgi:hypothetical protein
MELVGMFLIGMLSALGALVFEFILSILVPSANSPDLVCGFSGLMLGAIFIEESFKWALIWKISQITLEKKEIFLKSIAIGIGFSFAEILLNMLGHSQPEYSTLYSYLGLFLIHTVTASLLGYYFSSNKDRLFWKNSAIFSLAAILHFFFNVTVLCNFNPGITYALLAIIGVFLFFRSLKISRDDCLPSLKK